MAEALDDLPSGGRAGPEIQVRGVLDLVVRRTAEGWRLAGWGDVLPGSRGLGVPTD
jgi:hypothetical protein